MKLSNWKTVITLFLGVGLTLLGIISAEDIEKKVKMKDLPPAVQQTVKEVSKGATIRGLAQETEKGHVFYEVELKVNDHTKDVLIDSSGAVVVIEEEVRLVALPPAVKSTIEQQASGGKIVLVESITKGNTLVAYEAKVKKSGKTREIKVGPDGALIKE